jgi:hypothetical protein
LAASPAASWIETHTMHKHLLLAAIAVSGLIAPAAARAGCIAISSIPATLSAPGQYCLTKNYTVNLTKGNAITIATNGVTLDCAGHTIRNTATSDVGTSNGISMGSRNDIVIKNCRIIGGFNTGINVFQFNNSGNKNFYVTVDNNYVAGPFLHGIRAWGSAIEVTNNRVYDIGGQKDSDAFGIRVGGGVGFKFQLVRGNLVTGTNSPYRNAYGIYSDGSIASLFLENGIVGSSGAEGFTGYGVQINGSFNRVTDNHVTDSGTPNSVGIHTDDDTSACYDNYLRNAVGTENCDATLGNY